MFYVKIKFKLTFLIQILTGLYRKAFKIVELRVLIAKEV